jgi:hypothetical protein
MHHFDSCLGGAFAPKWAAEGIDAHLAVGYGRAGRAADLAGAAFATVAASRRGVRVAGC